MLSNAIKHRIFTVSFFVIIAVPVFVHAQMDDYDFAPRIRSYLQRPVSETQGYVEDVSVPQFTEEREPGEIGREVLPEERPMELPEVSAILLDKKVDPEQYIVGPGDLVNVYIWGELDKEFPLRVSPEGYVIIPTVGPVMVADNNLADVRSLIEESVHKKYHGIDITVYLVEPRRFRVFISGVIENPGMYNAHSLLRVSDLLGELARVRRSSSTVYEWVRGGLYTRSGAMTTSAKKGSSKRLIHVVRGDSVLQVDLLRFEKLGELDTNPYVTGGDHIIIPKYSGDIAVFGEVNNVGIYEYKPGDRVLDLIKFSGGLTVVADTSNASLVRFSTEGDQLEESRIDLYDALIENPDDPQYLLRESDRLFVQTKYRYKILANVTVDGQVKYPGLYAIIPHETKLTDIVQMAGGFTDFANLEEARIIRPVSSAIRDLEYNRLRRMLVADMKEEEYEYFKHRSRVPEGMISIDFVKLFEENDLTYDVFLEEGDHIFVPLKRELVNVLGAVEEPGYVKVEMGRSLEYYINLAGGYNWNAKTRNVRIIKARTGQRLKPGKNVTIEGGDTIHIPEKQPIEYWQAFLDGAQLFANMATLIIITQNLTK